MWSTCISMSTTRSVTAANYGSNLSVHGRWVDEENVAIHRMGEMLCGHKRNIILTLATTQRRGRALDKQERTNTACAHCCVESKTADLSRAASRRAVAQVGDRVGMGRSWSKGTEIRLNGRNYSSEIGKA